MIIGCMRECIPSERERIQQVLETSDKLLFFKDYHELLHSTDRNKIDILIGEPPLDILRSMKGLQWLQMTWAGVDMYMGEGRFPEDVRLTNASGAFGKIISEYILTGLLGMYRKMPDYRVQMKSGGWQAVSGERTLEGKTALILGAGDIGCETARKLKAFDVRVWGIRRVMREKPLYFDAMYTMEQLDELLPQADIVIACLPGTEQTRGVLLKKRLLSMKKDAFLVNVGRGSLVGLKDLTEVLEQGHLSGVLLDVMEQEPLPVEHPLRQMEQVMLTPHISGISWGDIPETRMKILDIFCENLCRFRKGEELLNLVDLKQGYRSNYSASWSCSAQYGQFPPFKHVSTR